MNKAQTNLLSAHESRHAKNDDLSSKIPHYVLLTGTLDFEKHQKVLENIEKCGSIDKEFVSPNSEIKNFVLYCDNRACENKECMKHRLAKYMRYHQEQINILKQSIRKPKAWVFTDGILQFPLDRKYCQQRMKLLCKLLKDTRRGSVTEHSAHMELKMKKEGGAYLHFHVVAGGVKDLRFIRKRWGKQIKYEDAIKPDELGYYVSKYASKTPHFMDEYHQRMYLECVYKLQMHRFSSGHSKYHPSGWYTMDQLEWEAYNAWRGCEKRLNNNPPSYEFYKQIRDKPPPKKITLDDYLN